MSKYPVPDGWYVQRNGKLNFIEDSHAKFGAGFKFGHEIQSGMFVVFDHTDKEEDLAWPRIPTELVNK